MANTKNSRRSFMTSTTSLLGLGGLAKFSQLAHAQADGGAVHQVAMTSDVAPLVRLIESTPREEAVQMMVRQLQEGVEVERFVAAMFLASARINVSPHHVFMIYAALRMSQEVSPEHRLLPLFWALDTALYRRESGDRYPPVDLSRQLSVAQAKRELHQAMERFDAEKAESAIIWLARGTDPQSALAQLWRYVARDDSFIGHRAIAMVNSWRVLNVIGWRHAEPILQFVVRRLNAGRRRHLQHRANLDRSQRVKQLAPRWNEGATDPDATLELFNVMRAGDDAAACEAAYKMLASGAVQAGSLWDAVYLLGADFLVRFPHSHGIGTTPVHTNTSANALRYAFETCGDPQIQLYTVLAAVAWATGFYGVQVARDNLRDLNVTKIDRVDVSGSNEDAVADVFSRMRNRNYDVSQKQIRLGREGTRGEMDDVAQAAFSYASKHADHRPFLHTARLLASVKSTQDAHDMKFPSALFENYEFVNARWRPHLLAASTHYLHGTNMIDNPAVQKAKAAVGGA